MLAYLTILVVFLIYYLVTKTFNYWKSRGFPQVKLSQQFGNFYDIIFKGRPISEQITKIYNNYKHHPYVGIYTLTKPVLLINKPDIIKRILVKDFKKITDRGFASNEKADPVAAHTLFMARSHVWRNIRTKLTPVFTSGKIKLMLPLMNECGVTLSHVLQNSINREINARILMRKYAVDVISSCAFGINSNCLTNDHSEIFEAARRLLDTSSITANLSRLCYAFVPRLVDIFNLKFANQTATKYLIKLFNTTWEERQKLNVQRNDLISLLNQLKKTETINDDYKFDDIKLAAQAIVFFSAGNEATSITMTLALYELALNKTIQNKLRDEIRESYQKHNGFTYESIQEMTYLNMVLNETLRRYSVTPSLNRECTEDYLFDETGDKIEKGTSLMIPTCALHLDPEYFPEPEKFDPERFNNQNDIKQFTYLPWGEGPRICIGQRFAQLAVKVAIVHALKDFRFDVTENTEIPLKFEPLVFLLEVKNRCLPLKVQAL